MLYQEIVGEPVQTHCGSFFLIKSIPLLVHGSIPVRHSPPYYIRNSWLYCMMTRELRSEDQLFNLFFYINVTNKTAEVIYV